MYISLCTSTLGWTYWTPPKTAEDPTFTIQAPLHELRWKSSDRMAAPETAPSVHSSKGGEDSKSESSRNISTETIVAIGIGVPLAIILLAGALFFCRKRARYSREVARASLTTKRQSYLPEVHDSSQAEAKQAEQTPMELGCNGIQPTELPASSPRIYEAEGMPSVQEMD